MPFESGQKIGRYRISRLVAQGGMAEVYRAEQELTAGIFRPVALKVIRPEYSESIDFREMFLDEARTACTLSHPNIVHIYEVGEADGLLFMAMELVPGETLATVARSLREQNERFSDEALFAIGIGCCSALEAVHALKVEGGHVNLVHRDVSPHNLLLSSNGALKLIDFGIAKAATNRNLTNPGVTKGKAGYFSPEQAMGKLLDGRSDLFSLGVTLYKLACGNTPFDVHKTHAERNGALVRGLWEPLEKVYPGLTEGFYEVVGKSLKLKPEARYPDARSMREDLEKAAFDAGFRIGQSNLIGYVDNDGEITAVPSGTRTAAKPTATGMKAVSKATVSARAPTPPPGAPPRRRTEHLMGTAAAGAKTRPKWLVPVAFALAVVSGVAIAGIALATRAPEPKPQVIAKAPVVPLPKKPPSPEPVFPPEVVVKEDPDPPKPAPPDPVVDALPPPVKKPVVPKQKVVAAVTPVKVEEPQPPPVKQEIPAGEGKLRIGVVPAGAASRILVDRKDWGPPPVNNKISSGEYRVVVELAGGKKSKEWRGAVMPDRITTLEYDIESERWNSR